VDEDALDGAWEALRQRCEVIAAMDGPDYCDVAPVLSSLDQVWLLLRAARVARDAAVPEAKRQGARWQEIADTLRVERQVVWRKYNQQAARPVTSAGQ
jgi:hypothetical protein